MEFVLFLPQMRMSFADMVGRARAAEAAGFVGIAGMDHMAPPMAEEHAMYEAMTTSTWLAAATTRLKVGSLVLCDTFRHPSVLAREAVSLDHASGGRFELGIGSGSVPDELPVYGVSTLSTGARVSRLRETLEILRALWTGESVTYKGEFFTLDGARQVPTPLDRIPIVIGAMGPRMMGLVREFADWWNVPVNGIPRLDELRAHAGDARPSVQHGVALVQDGADPAAVEALAMRRIGFTQPAIGSASQLVDHFGRLGERGVERIYAWFHDFGDPDSLAAFGAEVITPLTTR